MADVQPSTFNLQPSTRNLLLLAGCVAFIQIACYYLAGATVRSDGAMAIAQPDTMLYCQAARRIVEGAPFSYSAGTAVSTGTTSVVYPFILAVPYALGCKGDLLITAGFALNAAFYLVFLLGWCALACRVFAARPESAPHKTARILSVALLATFGPFAYCALAQSDIGLWMAVSAWLAYGLYTDRKGLYVPLLLLAPWVRPEGMVVVASYCAFWAIGACRRRRLGVEAWVAVATAVSVMGVFALNYALTGECQFSSVAHKGYFKNLSFASAVYSSAIDLMRIAKAYLLGLPQNAPRDFYFLPLVGAACMWFGAFSRDWRNVSWRELAWYLAMAGGIATVATSGWQNTNLDRYLVWIMPVLLLYMAFGADRLRFGVCGALPVAILLLAFNVIMAVAYMSVFRYSAEKSDMARAFAARCEVEMPKGCSIGTWGGTGIAYEFLPRRMAHISGIYSPEFNAESTAAKYEILKNEPKTRFDYWFCCVSDHGFHFDGKPDVMAGEVVLAGPPGFELRKPDWKAYDAARECKIENVKCKMGGEPRLAARIDVAYEKDEKAFGYEALTRDDYPLFAPFVSVGKLNGTNIVECGRFLLGGDAMTVPLVPGKDVHVVMRTALKCSASVWRELGHERSDFTFKSPMTLKVMVDGNEAGDVEFAVGEGDFHDAHFTIPGKALGKCKMGEALGDESAYRLTFLGEHVSFCYWFFQ